MNRHTIWLENMSTTEFEKRGQLPPRGHELPALRRRQVLRCVGEHSRRALRGLVLEHQHELCMHVLKGLKATILCPCTPTASSRSGNV